MKFLSLSLLLLFTACSSTYYRDQTAEKLDILRFMGKWYVISHIPTFLETDSYNAIETYSLEKDKTIDVDFRYNEGSLDGDLQIYNQVGWVYDQKTKAHWKIRPFWPLRFDYLVHYVADDYSAVLIGVPDHEHLWIMSRTPILNEVERIKMEEMAEDLGYDLSKLRQIPQQDAISTK